VADAVVGKGAALDHGRKTVLSLMRKLKVASQCRLDIGIN
jgi:hypothetical protein